MAVKHIAHRVQGRERRLAVHTAATVQEPEPVTKSPNVWDGRPLAFLTGQGSLLSGPVLVDGDARSLGGPSTRLRRLPVDRTPLVKLSSSTWWPTPAEPAGMQA